MVPYQVPKNTTKHVYLVSSSFLPPYLYISPGNPTMQFQGLVLFVIVFIFSKSSILIAYVFSLLSLLPYSQFLFFSQYYHILKVTFIFLIVKVIYAKCIKFEKHRNTQRKAFSTRPRHLFPRVKRQSYFTYCFISCFFHFAIYYEKSPKSICIFFHITFSHRNVLYIL